MAADEMGQYLESLYQIGIDTALNNWFKPALQIKRTEDAARRSKYLIEKVDGNPEHTMTEDDLGLDLWKSPKYFQFSQDEKTADLFLPDGPLDRFRLDRGIVLSNDANNSIASVGIALGRTYPRGTFQPFDNDLLILSIADRNPSSPPEDTMARLAQILAAANPQSDEFTNIMAFSQRQRLAIRATAANLIRGMRNPKALIPSVSLTSAIEGLFAENFHSLEKRRRLAALSLTLSPY